ncbi:hypothetical protein BGZ94_001578 [Podila epigama]|nr:hypothetical protein BGZ94_001578 [Podila epigama]
MHQVFSSFYNLLPEAKEQLSSDLSIFRAHSDAYVMLFFFTGVGLMALIHWIMHRFDAGSSSPGIENSNSIEQFMEREQAHYRNYASSLPSTSARGSAFHAPPPPGLTAPAGTAVADSLANACNGCILEETDRDDEDERYNDSEYVDDEVTSLLNNAFLQIGKTPNSRMDDTVTSKLHRHGVARGGNGDDGDDDDDGDFDSNNVNDDNESIEVVIADQKDKILRRPQEQRSNFDLDLEDDHDSGSMNSIRGQHQRRSSWSSVSTREQKPFAPVNKRRKNSAASKAKGRRRAKETQLDYTTDRRNAEFKHYTPASHHHHHHHQHANHSNSCQRHGLNTLTTYGSVAPSTTNGSALPIPRHTELQNSGHMRRTSFPRLSQKGSRSLVYSSHDNLDHAVTDDREHTDLTEIGIQTALTIAVHKFPEGLITFLSTTADPCLGLSVFMAIAVHNLIEGYLIAFPLFVGLHSRSKAFALAAALGGLSQPLGAILGWFILRKVASMGWQVAATGVIYALVAGMMASIAVNGMWPQAVKCVGRKKTKVVQFSFFAGIAIMGICQAVMGTTCDF